MKSYTKNPMSHNKIFVNTSKQGETIEQKISRIVNNKEPIKDGAPIIHTERKDGVQPQYNIRADRFEIALDATTAIHKTHVLNREERAKKRQAKTVTTTQDDQNDPGQPAS